MDENDQEKFLLEVSLIRSDSDLTAYDDYLHQLPDNPFIKKELLSKNTDEEFGISIDGTEILQENFSNVDSIFQLLIKNGVTE